MAQARLLSLPVCTCDFGTIYGMAQARLLSLIVCTCGFGTIYSMAQAGLLSLLTCTCDFGTLNSMSQAGLLLTWVLACVLAVNIAVWRGFESGVCNYYWKYCSGVRNVTKEVHCICRGFRVILSQENWYHKGEVINAFARFLGSLCLKWTIATWALIAGILESFFFMRELKRWSVLHLPRF